MEFKYKPIIDKEIYGIKKPYNLSIPIQTNWDTVANRVLVIIPKVTQFDIRAKKFLKDEKAFNTYINVIKFSEKIAKKYNSDLPEHAYCFLNYQFVPMTEILNSKNKQLQENLDQITLDRTKRMIEVLQPTKIVVFDDYIAGQLIGKKDIRHYHGWIHDVEGKSVVNVFNINGSFSSQNESGNIGETNDVMANKLGHVSRLISNLLLGYNPHSLAHIKPKYTMIDTIPKLDNLLAVMNVSPVIAIDTETTGLETLSDQILTIQISFDTSQSFIIPIYHFDSPWTEKNFKLVLDKLHHFFSKKQGIYTGKNNQYFIGQNFGFDIRMLMRLLNIRYWYFPTWDTMAGEYTFDENIADKVTLNSLKLDRLFTHYGNDFYYQAQFSKAQRTTIKDVSLTPDVLNYCAIDTQAVFGIHNEQLKRTEIIEGKQRAEQYKHFNLVHISSTVRVMSAMRYRGTTTDVNYLFELLKPNSAFMLKYNELDDSLLRTSAVKQANKLISSGNSIPDSWDVEEQDDFNCFNINKDAHKEVLYSDVLELEPLNYGKSGKPSYDKEFIKHHAAEEENLNIINGVEQDGVLTIILKLQQLRTVKNSFLDSIAKKINTSKDYPRDNRLRPNYKFTLVTGRSSSNDPNFQQLPIHSDIAKFPKRLLITPPMFLHLEMDYASHEVRCLGIMSQDDAFKKSFINIHNVITAYRLLQVVDTWLDKTFKGDSHKQNYSMFTGTPITDITKAMRQIAKTIIFGLMYGKTIRTLAKDIGKTEEETQIIVDDFFSGFYKSKEFLDYCVNNAKEHYFLDSPLGRRRHLFGMLSGDEYVRMSIERKAKNSPIQGFASDICFMSADIFSRALHECYEKLGINHNCEGVNINNSTSTYLPTAPNVMVHDSIKVEAHFDLYLLTLHLLEWAMTNGAKNFIETHYNFKVNTPFDVDSDIGASWATKTTWDWSEIKPDNNDSTLAENIFKPIDPLYHPNYFKFYTERSKLNKRELLLKAIYDHKDIYKDNKEVQELDPIEVVDNMFAKYEQQRVILELDKTFPLNNKIIYDIEGY